MPAKREATPPARFGLPIKTEREGGTTLHIELVLKKGEYLYALRQNKSDQSAFPKDLLNFGEDFDQAVRRILRQNAKATLDDFWIATVKSKVDALSRWTITIVVVAEIDDAKPAKGYHLEQFTESTIPAGLVGWSARYLRDVLVR